MDLSDADIKLLGAIRRRTRSAKCVMALFAVMSLLLASAAIWFSIEACRPSPVQSEQDPLWPVALLVHQGQVFAVAFFGLSAVLHGMGSLFVWSQSKSDNLTLKLIDRASGYPPSSL